MKDIRVKLSKEGITDLKTYIVGVKSSIQSEDLIEFIAEKVNKVLLEVQNERLTTADRGLEDEEYRRNHQYHIDGNKLYIYNNTIKPPDKISEKYRANYPNGFDIAKAVEYGVGLVGAGSDGANQADKDGWQYDVKGQGYQGYSGRLIYYTTMQRVQENIGSWIEEYIEKNI